jgi:hypothetical protein
VTRCLQATRQTTGHILDSITPPRPGSNDYGLGVVTVPVSNATDSTVVGCFPECYDALNGASAGQGLTLRSDPLGPSTGVDTSRQATSRDSTGHRFIFITIHDEDTV